MLNLLLLLLNIFLYKLICNLLDNPDPEIPKKLILYIKEGYYILMWYFTKYNNIFRGNE